MGEGSEGRGHNQDLSVQVPACNQENPSTKEVTPAPTNVRPRNLALEGRNQDGSVVTLRHSEVSGIAVHLHVKVRCGCSHPGKARSQSAGGKRKAQGNANLTPTEEKASTKKKQASNFKREAQSSDEDTVSADKDHE